MSFPANTNAKITKQENQSKLTHIYTALIPYETFTTWAQANRELKNVKGFRQGHAPLSYFKDDWAFACAKTIASEIMTKENFNNIYDSTYILSKFELGQDIELKINIELHPQIPEIEFEKIKLTKHTAKIQKSDITNAIEKFKLKYFKPVDLETDRKAQTGDFLKLSIDIADEQGKKEKVENMEVHLGYNTFLPEIEQKLIGISAGETINHDFKIPESGSAIKDPKLIGKNVHLTFNVHKVMGERNFNDQDIIEHFGLSSHDEIESKFEEELQKEATTHSNFLLKESLKQELLKHFFEIPMNMLQQKYEELRQQMLNELGYKQGDDLSTLVKEKLNTTVEEFEKRSIFIAEAIARLNFLISYFANKMKIEISTAQMDDAIAGQKNAFPQGLQEAVKFFAENEKAREGLKYSLLENKVLLSIASKCQIETKEHSLSDFYKINLQNSGVSGATDELAQAIQTNENDTESAPKKKVNKKADDK